MIPKRLINIDKVKKFTGWTPQTSLDIGLQKTIEWYKEHYKNISPEQEI